MIKQTKHNDNQPKYSQFNYYNNYSEFALLTITQSLKNVDD